MAEITTHLFLFQSGIKNTFQRREQSIRCAATIEFSIRDPFTETDRAFFFNYFPPQQFSVDDA